MMMMMMIIMIIIIITIIIILINFEYTKILTSAHLHETSKATTYNITQLISRFACPNLSEF